MIYRIRTLSWGLTGCGLLSSFSSLILCCIQKQYCALSLSYAIHIVVIAAFIGSAFSAISGILYEHKLDYCKIPGLINHYEKKRRLKKLIVEIVIIIVINMFSFFIFQLSFNLIERYDIHFF